MTRTRPARRLGAAAVLNLGIIALGLLAIVGLLVAGAIPGEERSPDLPPGLSLRLESVAEGLSEPVLLLGAGDGSGDRLVVEQRGRVLRLAADGTLEPEPLLDISGRVLHHHERGLLGLALHPAYADNGRLFVAYSRREDGATSISQFTLPLDGSPEPGAAEATEKVLLTIPQPFTTHKAGMLAFDHDGMLVAAIGDGGSGNDPLGNGQDPASLLGALLRLDVDRGWPYAIPPDNGFAGDPAARSEVHAIGLRNPWRFSVDRLTGDLYIGDVGQGDWEEIDVLRPGTRRASFGWSVMEGRECFYGRPCDPADHIPPAVAYPHVDGDVGHCSVIGGYAYRGSAGSLPDGTYLYADYCSGTIWGVPAGQLLAGDAQPQVVGQVPAEMGLVTSFGEDDDGELYLVTDAGYVLAIDGTDRPAEPA